MQVVFGADHAGFELKKLLIAGLTEQSGPRVSVLDLGTTSLDSVDYPDYAHLVAEAVLSGSADVGVLICGTGVGMSIAANRHAGIRAVCCSDIYTAAMARAHNSANVLALGARVVGPGLAQAILERFLMTAFEGGRHQRRVEKIEPPSSH